MLIVSRYNEDIDWISEFDRFQIYNKGLDDISLNSIPLPNVGRESHTYLHHIITNYDNLDDIMIFSQGRYRDHFDFSPKEFKKIMTNIWNNGFSASSHWLQHGHYHSNREDFCFYEGLCDFPGDSNLISLKEWWESTTGESYVVSENVFFKGIFSVSKKFIMKRSLESYKRIYLSLCSMNNPVEGHFCERSWFNILNLPLKSISCFKPLI